MRTSGSNRATNDRRQDNSPGNDCLPDSPSGSSDWVIGEISRHMLTRLNQTIEGDIIPRLMLAFDSPGPGVAAELSAGALLQENIEEFVHLVLNHDATVATEYVSTLRSEGIPLPALYLDLLAPTARRLGVMWEEDECSFTDVTIGVCRLHQVLLEFSRCFDATEHSHDSGLNALVVPVPGEQHTFGIFMVLEFLRRAGWNCFSGVPRTRREFLRLVRAREFDVIGFSISADLHLETAAELITEIRRGSRNADTKILTGGRAIMNDPQLAASIGADAMAADGREAVRQMSKLCPDSKRSSGQ